MIHNIILPTEDIIARLLDWLVKNNRIITLVILSLLALLLLLVAIRLFRQSSRRPVTSKTRPQSPSSQRTQVSAGIGSVWQLVDANGQIIPLEPLPFTIGRQEDNTLVLDDESIAPRHARIFHDTNWQSLLIETLDPPTGILVDDKPTCKNLLQSGTKLSIGRYTFTLNQKTS